MFRSIVLFLLLKNINLQNGEIDKRSETPNIAWECYGRISFKVHSESRCAKVSQDLIIPQQIIVRSKHSQIRSFSTLTKGPNGKSFDVNNSEQEVVPIKVTCGQNALDLNNSRQKLLDVDDFPAEGFLDIILSSQKVLRFHIVQPEGFLR